MRMTEYGMVAEHEMSGYLAALISSKYFIGFTTVTFIYFPNHIQLHTGLFSGITQLVISIEIYCLEYNYDS
jgi:hypothetical protein